MKNIAYQTLWELIKGQVSKETMVCHSKEFKSWHFKCQPFFRPNELRVLMKLWNSLQWPISIITSLIILNYPRRIRPINFWSTYSHHEVSSGLEYHRNGSYSNLIARQCLSYDNQEVIGLCHQKKFTHYQTPLWGSYHIKHD